MNYVGRGGGFIPDLLPVGEQRSKHKEFRHSHGNNNSNNSKIRIKHAGDDIMDVLCCMLYYCCGSEAAPSMHRGLKQMTGSGVTWREDTDTDVEAAGNAAVNVL